MSQDNNIVKICVVNQDEEILVKWLLLHDFLGDVRGWIGGGYGDLYLSSVNNYFVMVHVAGQ